MSNTKKAYASPQLTVHGDVEVLTQKNQGGSALDADQKAGTPLTSLTTS
jgi:hypothetical protein